MRRFTCILILPILACGSGAAAPSRGEIVARWTGSAQGVFRAPAIALWCARDTLLELLAARHDTAVGFAILPRDSLGTGVYPVFTTKVFVTVRPQANGAARWLDQVDLKGFEGTSGNVTLSSTEASGVSGTFEVALRRSENPDSITIRGSFARVPIGKAIDACGRANRPGAG